MINIRISHDSIMSKVSMMIIGYGDDYDNYRHNPTPRIDLFVAPSVCHEIPSASWIYASCIHALGPGSGFGGSRVYIIKMQ